VLSTVAAGTIQSIDASVALSMPGVVALITAHDIAAIGGSNNCGDFPGDEEIFASTTITHRGQTIGMIVADTRENAKAAAAKVVVTYGAPATPPIFTIADAITAKSFLTDNQYVKHMPSISNGDINKGFSEADFIYTGMHAGYC
jgi:xanthine dehydrogenase/oxidase